MAHSDPSVISIQTDTITCPICFDNFSHPKTLPCGHSLCLDPCLRDLAKIWPIQCPLCRKVIDMPLSGRIEDLPTNFVVKNLLESAQEGEETKTPIEDEKISWINKGSENICIDHDETCDFFCTTCDAVVCSKCLLSTHKVGHHHIVAAAEYAREKIDTLLQVIDKIDLISTSAFQTNKTSFKVLERMGSYYRKVPEFKRMLTSLNTQKQEAKTLSNLLVEDLCRCDFQRVKMVKDVNCFLASTGKQYMEVEKLYKEIERDVSRFKKFGMVAAAAVGISFGIPFIPL